ncbi:MAG: hypothetical protein A2Z18_05805 [Armatimonadetes bacterium RBG_16_58_9]|nr:MAG: hypothetical protein A2Z18_05805 [Armatimonadetes bacterium RBG_16_58_9]
MRQSILEEVKRALTELPSQPNVTRLPPDEIRRRAEEFGRPTKFGNYNWISSVKNRSTALTVAVGGEDVFEGPLTSRKRDIKKGAAETVRLVHDYLKKAPLIGVECTMGDNPDFAPRCTTYVSVYRRELVRLAHKVLQMFFPDNKAMGPELMVVVIPEWHEKDRQVLVFPEIGVTYVLGTDYFGEVKNALLRMAMWYAGREGMLGLHAACQIVNARRPDGGLRKLGVMMFGIAATGKTTHACHDHGLDAPGESVGMVQDEVMFWRKDGSALGSERGFYIKTDGLDPETHGVLYDAATRKSAVLDNVMVDYEGSVYFDDRTLTANGRAIIQRDELGDFAGESVNMPPLAELDGLILAFMCRNHGVVPIAGKLTCEQAAVAFLLSESIDATGADSKMPVGPGKGVLASPFLLADPAGEAAAFHDFVKCHADKIECYLLNTGGVGEMVDYGLDGVRKVQRKVTRVSISEMASIIRGIARGTTQWREDPNWMTETLHGVPGVDMAKFELSEHYDQGKIDSLIASVRLERSSYLNGIKGLDPAIRNAVEF